MEKLYQKVLMTMEKYHHQTADDIYGVVNKMLIELREQYAKEASKNKIEAGYISTEFKSYMTSTQNNKSSKHCLLEESNIANFIKGNSKNIRDKSKDFFAVYCGFEGYYDFISHPIESNEKVSGKATNEKYQLAGTTIIDSVFFDNIKTLNFSMDEFYTAMYNDDCQWFGVIQGWDIERKHFEEIKNKIKDVFESRKILKVSFVVHGNDGVGKTCFLRRIAKELHQEQSFIILWLNNKTDIFLEEGLKTIEEKSDTNFLIFIEDWEKAFGKKDSAIVNDFLEETKNIPNMRIIIGDRDINKDYTNFLNNDIEPLLLSTEENKDIIDKIVENNTLWQKVSKKLFKNPENYNCSLFLLIFIIAHFNKEEFKNGSYDLSEARTVFKNIIESDLKFIAEKENGRYKGLAKALYYWGNIYSMQNVFISYATFLQVADYFNGDKKMSKSFEYWENNDSKILNTLKMYITKNESGLIKFNHDILAIDGISKITYFGWDDFGYPIKIQLLDVIINYGDDNSASEFFSALIKKRINMVLDEKGKWSEFEYCNLSLDIEKKLFYVNKLINKKNRHPSYIQELLNLIQNDDNHLNKYAELLWENEIFTEFFWRRVLHIESIRKFWLSKICTLESFARIDGKLVNYIISNYGKENVVKSTINEILKDESWNRVDADIIWSILINAENNIDFQSFADKILKIVNCVRLYPDILSLCIPLSSSNVREKFINTIFHNKFSKTPNFILNISLKYIRDDLKHKFASKFFKEVNWEKCESYIVLNMMESLESEERQETVKNILKKNNYLAISSEILKFCLETSSKTIHKIEFIERVVALPLSSKTFRLYSILLNYYYFADEKLREKLKNNFRELVKTTPNTIVSDIVSQYLKITKDQQTALSQLRYWIVNDYNFNNNILHLGYKENYHNDLITRCLMCFENYTNSLPDEVELTIKKIISDFNTTYCLESNPYYLLLLKLSFHNCVFWKNETKHIIDNWKIYDRKILYSVLGSHLYFPDEIKSLCKHIMICWNVEQRKITHKYREHKEYGEHLIVAMGHPDLKHQAKKTAKMMLQDKKKNLSENFIEIIENIVSKDKYPIWNPYDSDFQDLPIYILNPINLIIE